VGGAYVAQLRDDVLAGTRPLFLHELTLPKDLSLVVLAPHPDDFDIIAITMRRFRDNGNAIHVGVLTSGASGVEDDFCSPPSVEKKGALREQEQRDSCHLFGLPEPCLVFLRLQEDADGHPAENMENAGRVKNYLTAQRPDMVFLPHGNDTNPGHQRVYSMFRKLAPEMGYPIAAFYNHDPKTIAMRYDLFAVFDEEDARWKARLLRCHASQHCRNLKTRNYGIDDRILQVDQSLAAEYVKTHAYTEAFELEFWG
jgi:LmbE family N-acetylglucosaminyl deacetylase